MDEDWDRDEQENEDEEQEDGKKMEGQLGLTDASCQRPWREQTPAAGERAMTSISLMSPSIIFSDGIFHHFLHKMTPSSHHISSDIVIFGAPQAGDVSFSTIID